MSRAGRARKQGARYPDGRLKPQTGEDMAPTTIRRIRYLASIAAVDERLGTPLGVLMMEKKIPENVAKSGWDFARLKGAYDFEMGLPKRSAKSPAYGQGYRPFARERQIELEDAADTPVKLYETDEERDERVRALKERYNYARGSIAAKGIEVINVVERCCVDEAPVAYWEIPMLIIGIEAYAAAMDRRPARGERRKAVAA